VTPELCIDSDIEAAAAALHTPHKTPFHATTESHQISAFPLASDGPLPWPAWLTGGTTMPPTFPVPMASLPVPLQEQSLMHNPYLTATMQYYAPYVQCILIVGIKYII